ncbi:ER lumen protein-retaining receptor-like [Olea europaea var. sylvestris]|uniref:ER lumen protein-retaining receptor-like n=1 Tax=Olea europaea var. sylvestris TaxID=158386 RepID=UPI000C1D371F|nr:ER lumen protein-retaining receptor-like [Olea europaea var. sylvestris]
MCCDRILWAFSLYLEAVAILPQLVLLQRTRNIDNLTGQYVFFSGLGFLDLFRHCFTPISFIITSKVKIFKHWGIFI